MLTLTSLRYRIEQDCLFLMSSFAICSSLFFDTVKPALRLNVATIFIAPHAFTVAFAHSTSFWLSTNFNISRVPVERLPMKYFMLDPNGAGSAAGFADQHALVAGVRHPLHSRFHLALVIAEPPALALAQAQRTGQAVVWLHRRACRLSQNSRDLVLCLFLVGLAFGTRLGLCRCP